MARYLVVAHQTVTNPLLLEAVRGVREQDAAAEFVLLIPATAVRNLLFRKADERDAEATARKRGERAQAWFAKKGVPLSDVRVGAADPAEAIDQEIAAHPAYAGVVISTLPAETSRWLRMNLPRMVRTKHGLPVHHVVAAPEFGLSDVP
jgi:GABA permease